MISNWFFIHHQLLLFFFLKKNTEMSCHRDPDVTSSLAGEKPAGGMGPRDLTNEKDTVIYLGKL